MAITPNEVFDRWLSLSASNFEKLIDNAFEDEAFVVREKEVRSIEGMTFACWKVILPGEPTAEEAKYLSSTYKAAGWDRALITTSRENGERPGLVQIELGKYQA